MSALPVSSSASSSSASTSSSSTSCDACSLILSADTGKRCAQCKQVWYCDVTCQKRAWKVHKATCQAASTSATSPSTSASTSTSQSTSVPSSRYTRIRLTPSLLPSRSPLSHFTYVPSHDTYESNLLLLLHGLGDTTTPYARLFTALQLPQTSGIIFRAPIKVPYMDDNWMWYESFDQQGEVRSVRSTDPSVRTLRSALCDVLTLLTTTCHWPAERIFLMGFSQGASVAIDGALTWCQEKKRRLGGVIAMSGLLLDSSIGGNLHGTPLLVTHGTQDDRVPLSTVQSQYKSLVEHCKTPSWEHHFVTFPKKHVMLNSKEETKAIMTFFGKHLALRSLAMEQQADIVEISDR